MATENQMVSRGTASVGGSIYEPWPQKWRDTGATWIPQVYPTSNTWIVPREEGYANEVEVERGEFDAVLRFYRKRDRSRLLVKEITVPLGVLEWLTGGAG